MEVEEFRDGCDVKVHPAVVEYFECLVAVIRGCRSPLHNVNVLLSFWWYNERIVERDGQVCFV